MRHLKALNPFFIKYKWRLILGIFFVVIANFFAVLSPKIISNVLDEVYNNVKYYQQITDAMKARVFRANVMNLVMKAGVFLLLLAVLRGIFMFLMRQTIIVMSRHIEYDQKNTIFSHYQKLDTAFFKSHATGDLMSRISEDVSRVRMYTGPAIMYTINLVMLTALSLWGMLRVNAAMTLYVLLPLPLMAFAIFYVNKIVGRKSEKIQAELSALTSQAQEAYSGIRVVKSFGKEQLFIQMFNRASSRYRKSTINLSLTEAIFQPTMNIFVGLSTLLAVFIGGWHAIKGEITPGNIAEFVIYINMLTFPMMTIGWTANMVQRAAISQRRINEFLDSEPTIINPEMPTTSIIEGNIEFKNVSFIYPHTGIKALSDFSLKIKNGERVAIIGRTGSGKSTIIHLLLRMYDAASGDVLIDNHSIKNYDLQHLREQISYVPQDVFLFSDTIKNNIAFGKENASDEDVRKAASMAAIDKEIANLSEGYETIVGERGVMLSGGQKQRVSIARALLKSPSVIIMDESLSAVDTQTEAAILKSMDTYLTGKTAIVITHRILHSWNFNQIIVLDDGKIVEHGTHDELMLLNGQYAELYRYQMSHEEEMPK